MKDPKNYEARSNIMWVATWALNTLIAQGKATDWMVHMIGQSVGAYTDATHGMTLSAVSLPTTGTSSLWPAPVQEVRRERLGGAPRGQDRRGHRPGRPGAMEAWMKEMGLVLHLAELGVTQDMVEGIAKGSFVMEGGYKVLTHQEIVEILQQSM